MSATTQGTQGKKGKSLDEEIAAAQERLTKLMNQKREKERKDLERNQKAITTLLRTEKLDTVPVEKWTEALPGLRRLLKVEEAKGARASAPASGPPAGGAPAGSAPKDGLKKASEAAPLEAVG
jgi:hypothetical protein